MLTDQEINRLNKFLENKTFNYQGLMIFNTKTMVDLDYKFEILGYKQMISVGELIIIILINKKLMKG